MLYTRYRFVVHCVRRDVCLSERLASDFMGATYLIQLNKPLNVGFDKCSCSHLDSAYFYNEFYTTFIILRMF